MADLQLVPKLEDNLKVVREKRDATRALISKMQEELTGLFGNSPNRPSGSMVEIERKLEELENKRTRQSLSLTEEKQLLKQIYVAEREKRSFEDRLNHDKKIDSRKAQIQELRNALKPIMDTVAELESKLTRARLAEKLGCKVDEMQKVEMECPADKIGKVIGKSGAMIKKIEELAGVSLDVSTSTNTVVIHGSSNSFEAAQKEITKIIERLDEEMEISDEMNAYMTANNTNVIEMLREQHPEVYCDVQRGNNKFIMRGQPDDLASLKEKLDNMNVVKKERELTSSEAVVIIGKKGVTIGRITSEHKVAIEVEKKSDEESLAILSGPQAHVDAALAEIEALLEANKEVTKSIPCSRTIVQGFLTAGGVRIKELQKKINESTREQSVGTVLLTFDNVRLGEGQSNMLIKGRNSAMSTAVAMVGEAIRELDTATVRIMADVHSIPQIIGKGGENIKKLREGKKINIEVDKKTGEIAINGLDQAEVAEAEAEVLKIIGENKVLKIPVDAALVDIQYRELIRSAKLRNEVTELAKLDLDKDENLILLRGTEENTHKAAEIVRSFLETNYFESIDITDADRDALLSGGKQSKIVSFAKELEVTLSADREKMTIQARGTMEKVKAAVKTIKAYLFGGEGTLSCKMPVQAEAIGVVIGKKGKVRQGLEEKYPGCSIYIHRTNDAITIRGPKEQACGLLSEVHKLVASARITETVEATEEQIEKIKKSNFLRRLSPQIAVQCTVEENTIKVRGIAADVKDAIALIDEQLTGSYTSTMELGTSQFAKIKAASRDASHFARMKQSSGASVTLDTEKNAVVVKGKKNNVKKAKMLVLDFLTFLVPGEMEKVKLPKVLYPTVAQAASLIEISTSTGATVCLDRDAGFILIQSEDKEKVTEATKIVKDKVSEAEQLLGVVELETTEAWLIPILIGKGGSRINAIRKESGCAIEINKEERTIVMTGTDEESVAAAKKSIDEALDRARKENVFVAVPTDAMARFVGKAGAHITKLRNEYAVEIETLKKGTMNVKLTGDQENVKACAEAINEWVQDFLKPEENHEIQIQRHHIAAIIGERGATIQSIQEEFGCRVDIDKDELLVSFRGDPVKRELALRKIEEIMAENPAPQRRPRAPRDDDEENNGEGPKDSQRPPAPKKTEEPLGGQKPEMVDPDAQKDRTAEFPSLPIGIAPPKKKGRNRKRKPKAPAADAAPKPSPEKPPASSADESSYSDEDERIKARDPTLADLVLDSTPDAVATEVDVIGQKRQEMEEAASKGDYMLAGRLQGEIKQLEAEQMQVVNVGA